MYNIERSSRIVFCFRSMCKYRWSDVEACGKMVWTLSFTEDICITSGIQSTASSGGKYSVEYQEEFLHAVIAPQDVVILWLASLEQVGLTWPSIPASVEQDWSRSCSGLFFFFFGFQSIVELLKSWCKSKLFMCYLDWNLPPTSLQQLTPALLSKQSGDKLLSCDGWTRARSVLRSVHALPGLYVSAVGPRQWKWTKIRESGHQSGEPHFQSLGHGERQYRCKISSSLVSVCRISWEVWRRIRNHGLYILETTAEKETCIFVSVLHIKLQIHHVAL